MPATVAEPAQFPAKLECLFKPKRTKVLWGGRGAGRSWGVARALLIQGAQRPTRVLCVREYQNSIADSVHQLISDQIDLLGFGHLYEILQKYILGRPGTSAAGTQFAFEGIKNNVNRIKSYEGIDICWAEEANNISQRSWSILIPTIRKEGSEIWVSFNPELETDYTYQRFVLAPDAQNSVVVKMTHRDNPWFPEVLRKEMEACKARDYDEWLNVWEGHCRQVLEGSVYAKELRRAQEEGRICQVPCDYETPVDVAFDLGRANNTAAWFMQRVAMQVRVLDYMEESGEDWPYYLQCLQSRGYTYGTIHLPHDAKAKRLGMPFTIEGMTRKAGFKVNIVPKVNQLTDGINAVRVFLKNCWFDEVKCADGLKALRHYRYSVVDGRLSNEPLHDWASDGADAFRTGAYGLSKTPSTLAARIVSKLSRASALGGRPDTQLGSTSWMRG